MLSAGAESQRPVSFCAQVMHRSLLGSLLPGFGTAKHVRSSDSMPHWAQRSG
jgi:hypothetical protein